MLTEKSLIPKEGEIASLESMLAEAKKLGATTYRVNPFGIQTLAKNTRMEELTHRLKIANENIVNIVREIAEERSKEIDIAPAFHKGGIIGPYSNAELIEKINGTFGEQIVKSVAKVNDGVKDILFEAPTPPRKGDTLIFESLSDMYTNFTVDKEYEVFEATDTYIYIKNDLMYVKSCSRNQPNLPSFWRKHFRLKESEQEPEEPLMEGTQLEAIAPFFVYNGLNVHIYADDEYWVSNVVGGITVTDGQNINHGFTEEELFKYFKRK